METATAPQRFVTDAPLPQSICLAGAYLNLRELERETGLTASYVSRILNGKAIPSIQYEERLAEALGMDPFALRSAIRARRQSR